MAHSKHMSVYSHSRFLKPYSKHHVGCFSAYTRELCKLVNTIWHLATISIGEHLRHLHKVFCLGIRIANALHIFQYFLHFCLRHFCGIRIASKEGWRYHVHTGVGALRTKHCGNEQLEGIAKIKLCGNNGHLLAKIIKDEGVALFSCHAV